MAGNEKLSLYGPFGLVNIIVYKLTWTYIFMTDHSRDCIPWLGNSKISVFSGDKIHNIFSRDRVIDLLNLFL